MLTGIEDSTAVVNNGSMLDGDTKEEIVADVDDDPLYERYLAQQSIPTDKLISISQVDIERSDDELSLDSMSDFPVGNYTHKYTASAGYDIKRGVDVSKYQGTINWSAAKADGVEFAFIRVGFRGYGASGSLNEDTTYKSNIPEIRWDLRI